jgi:hypothetical protein
MPRPHALHEIEPLERLEMPLDRLVIQPDTAPDLGKVEQLPSETRRELA